jgi:hypothetical protein
MKFTIRDLMWLTALVALALGWWLDRSRVAADASKEISKERMWRSSLVEIQLINHGLEGFKRFWGEPKDSLPNTSAPALKPTYSLRSLP